MGVEVEPVYEASDQKLHEVARRTQHLLCVQISKIEPGGRVARDGRLKIGDRIVYIDGRPVSQVFLSQKNK